MHPQAQRLIAEYLVEAGHVDDLKGPLFRPVRNNVTGKLNKALNPNSVYTAIVKPYAGIGVHSLRATAATNSLEHEADIAKVQEMLGHANISTTKLYERIGILKGLFGGKCRSYSPTRVDYEFEREHTGAFWASSIISPFI